MESLYLLIPLSVAAVFAVGVVLWWAVSGGQFDDLEGPAHQILMDDDAPPSSAKRTPPQ
jgi:cbb3-type cytochrome oxidase maturation protein